MKLILFGLLIALSFVGTKCMAQFLNIVPDCCQQAVSLQAKVSALQIRLDSTKAKLDTAKAVGSRLLKAKDLRISQLEQKGTEQIREGNSKLATVERELEAELVKSRFLGWGRRRWVSGLLKTVRKGAN